MKTALGTGLFLGGMVLSTPSLGAEIDDYVSSVQLSPSHVAHIEGTVVQKPTVSFDCNVETVISEKKDDAEILSEFSNSMLNGMKNLDSDISKWVDDNFWDLV